MFELMCKVLDQNLFAQVDWARNSYYFKELKVGQNNLESSHGMIYMKDFPNIFLPSTSSSSWWWGRHCCIIVHMERAWLVMQVWKIFTVGPPAKIFSVKLQNIFSYHHSQYPITPISDAELLLNSACSIWCRENFEIRIPGCVLYWTAFKILQCEVPFKKINLKLSPSSSHTTWLGKFGASRWFYVCQGHRWRAHDCVRSAPGWQVRAQSSIPLGKYHATAFNIQQRFSNTIKYFI